MVQISFESYIKFENETLRYLESPEGIKSFLNIESYYDLYIKEFQFCSSPKPEFNPWQYSTFKTAKKPKDVYSSWGKISKGFFITNKFKNFLKQFNIGEHVIFDKINYFNGEKCLDDLSYIAFYEDYSKFFLIQESTYFTIKKGDWHYVNDKYLPNYIERGLRFSNEDEKERTKNNLFLNDIELREENIFINTPKEVSLFPLYNLFNGVFFCSQYFLKNYKTNKLTGLTIGINDVVNVITPFD